MTTHYQAILGAFGTNLATGQPYEFQGSAGTSGQFGPVCTNGAFGSMRTIGTNRFAPQSNPISSMTDGTSNTFLLGEFSWTGYRFWRPFTRGWYADARGTLIYASKNVTYPLNSGFSLEWNDASLGSMHVGGAQFVYGDGSVHFISESIDTGNATALQQRPNGEGGPEIYSGPSMYGVWGALGSRNGGETAALP